MLIQLDLEGHECYSYTTYEFRVISIFDFRITVLNFRVLGASHNIVNSSDELQDLTNMGILIAVKKLRQPRIAIAYMLSLI